MHELLPFRDIVVLENRGAPLQSPLSVASFLNEVKPNVTVPILVWESDPGIVQTVVVIVPNTNYGRL